MFLTDHYEHDIFSPCDTSIESRLICNRICRVTIHIISLLIPYRITIGKRIRDEPSKTVFIRFKEILSLDVMDSLRAIKLNQHEMEYYPMIWPVT